MPGGRPYEPWVGANYCKPRSGLIPSNVRCLILGESTYQSPDDKEAYPSQIDYPSNLVRWRAFDRDHPRDRFIKGITDCFESAELGSSRAKQIWDDLAFWEYVQEPLCGYGISPTREQFEEGHAAFDALLKTLKPTHVIAVSKRLWQNMDDIGANYLKPLEDEPRSRNGDPAFGVYKYRRHERNFLLWGIYHPARPQYFNPATIRPAMREFLALSVPV